MPSYFYHLKLELYPSPDPTRTPTEANDRGRIWQPSVESNIFHDLPSHSREEQGTSRESPPSPAHLAGTRVVPESALNVIDCGGTRAPVKDNGARVEKISERQWLERADSFPPPPPDAALRPQTAVKDWRFGRVSIETVDFKMDDHAGPSSSSASAPELGPTIGGAGATTKAELLQPKHTEAGWGIVHFYREGEETPSLEDINEGGQGYQDHQKDCSTLCIPAIPVWMSPRDFLGFIGWQWMEDISHCRMVMTSKMNRYLVLLRFKDEKRAKLWRKEFDGKAFSVMESQVCHAVFVGSITFQSPAQPDTSALSAAASPSATASSSLKPFPPPTPNLIELPTCPVCLERMDETNGLMTIPCSHVFHCSCLQNWRGAGCPVCRFTNSDQLDSQDPANPASKPFGSSASNLCSVCDCTDDLWICLICGYVGCGRYKGGHAKDHWKETAHSFALELETQHVWDYAGDMWVHRLIRDKGDGKLVELPNRTGNQQRNEDEDVVPRAKLENIGLEYTHLLTSQLESQRAYYEDMLSKTADKASKASAAAEAASAQSSFALEKTRKLDEKYTHLMQETIPQMERDVERERARANKSQDLARNLSSAVQEEKRINEGLLKRIEHLGAENDNVKKQMEELKLENAELKEMNRDLTMFISGQEKLKAMEKEGQVEEGELEAGSASVPEKKTRRRKK